MNFAKYGAPGRVDVSDIDRELAGDLEPVEWEAAGYGTPRANYGIGSVPSTENVGISAGGAAARARAGAGPLRQGEGLAGARGAPAAPGAAPAPAAQPGAAPQPTAPGAQRPRGRDGGLGLASGGPGGLLGAIGKLFGL